MFHMEFHSLDAVEESDDDTSRTGRDDEGRESSVYEQNRGSPPHVYDGRVGKMQRVQSSNHAVHHTVPDFPPVMTRSLSTNDSVPKNWVEADLIDFGSPKQDPVFMSELVKPFAESVTLDNAASPDLLSNGVPTTAVSQSPNAASLRVRTSSVRSTNSDTSDAESVNSFYDSTGEVEKGSPATRAGQNRGFNKILSRKSKARATVVPGAPTVTSKPLDEPLLAAHDQAKLQRKLDKEAKAEAKRLAEEAKRDAEIRQRELLELANPVPESMLNHKKDQGLRKGIHKLFHIHTGAHSNQNSPKEAGAPDARESRLVMPRGGLFEHTSIVSPSTKEITLSQIRTGPRPSTKKDITFATVESNQRDVKPWTMEEYMAKNARQAEWELREDDEEFGGIEGNMLLNQQFNNDVMDTFDSDSD